MPAIAVNLIIREFTEKGKLKLTLLYPVLLVLMFSFFAPAHIQSQDNDLSFVYFNALNKYNAGETDSALSMLNSGLKNKELYRQTSKSTRANIYRLSALSCIQLYKQDEARANIGKMLVNDPDYRNNYREGDLAEFRNMADEFTVLPGITIGAGFFSDYSTGSIEKRITDHDPLTADEITNYREWGGGLWADGAITKSISAGLGINLLALSWSYNASDIPLSLDHTYNMLFRYVETPLYFNYNFMPDKKFRPFVRLTAIGRYYPSPNKTYGTAHRYQSDVYGTYYMQEDNLDGYNGVLAVFYKNYEYFDLSIGGGAEYSFRGSSIGLNIGYFPLHIDNNPLPDINNASDIPENELFRYADETIVVNNKRMLRIALSYKLFLNYRAY
jgi:hypothetical protein